MAGKLPPDLLARYVFSRIGQPDKRVLVGPAYGEDAAIIDMGDEVLVVHADPITGAVKHLGWLAVHVACNDIAVRGARPRWLVSVMLLPTTCTNEEICRITKELDEAAKEVGAMIVGGHSEYTAGLERPVIVMTAIGVAPKDKYIVTSGAKPGDVVLMTKTAGVEGTAILASDFREELLARGIEMDLIERSEKFLRMISVVREALALASLGAHSMHDPTEGGLLGGVAEIAYASRVRIDIWEERIPVAEETRVFCRALGIDPLRLISSGALLATLPKELENDAVKVLERVGIKASIIGEVRKGEGVILHKADGTQEVIGRYVKDELFDLWEKLKGKA